MNFRVLVSHLKKADRLLLVLAILVRVAALFASGQWQTENYWEYGILAQNVLNGKGYSFPFTDENLAFLPEIYPSALMPPGYVGFLLPFLLIQQVFIRNLLLFGVQIGVSVYAIWLLSRYIKEKVNHQVAMWFMLLATAMPDLVYASVSVGPTVFLHLLLALFLILNLRKNHNDWKVYGYKFILASLAVYFRSESFLVFILLFLIPFRKGICIKSLTVILLLALSMLPWMYRNYGLFGRWLFASNAGINFYRGNNPGQIGDWPPTFSPEALVLRTQPDTYELEFDRLAFRLATDWISKHPITALSRLPEKFARFWLLDWTDPRARSFWVVLPWFLCLALALYLPFWRVTGRWPEVLIILLTYTCIILVFFPQPRYLALVKPFFLVFAALGAGKLWRQLQNRWPSAF